MSISEKYIDCEGTVVLVHDEGSCVGEHCVLHNPSSHALSDAPLRWSASLSRMERICEHGFPHPDPDGIAAARILRGHEAAREESVHGCDGCCHENHS
jgi:hypothetical protein